MAISVFFLYWRCVIIVSCVRPEALKTNRSTPPRLQVSPSILDITQRHGLTEGSTWKQVRYLLGVPIRILAAYSYAVFPQKPKPVPYSNEKTPHRCKYFLKCSPKHPDKGIGQEGNSTARCAVALLAPYVTALSIVIGTSYDLDATTQRLNSCIFVKPRLAFAALLGVLVCSAYAGRCSTMFITQRKVEQSIVFILYGCVSTVFMSGCIVVAFRSGQVEFAWPRSYSTLFLQTVSMLRVMYYIAVGMILSNLSWYLIPCSIGLRTVLGKLGDDLVFTTMTFLAAGWSPPNLGLVLLLYMYSRVYLSSFFFWGDTTGVAIWSPLSWDFPTWYMYVVLIVLCSVAPYQRDRQYIAFTGYLAILAIKTGQRVDFYDQFPFYKDADEGEAADLSLRVCSLILFSALCILSLRYQRVLPVQLRKAKYVRLSYFYKMLRDEQKITRCQDVPDEAFGNPAKAMILIIISHRWLDRYTCDVETPFYTRGLRLTTMCERFEKYFPSRWPACSALARAPLSTYFNAIHTARLRDSDILVFFDFMALPQIGKEADGTIIQRTAEEQALFQEVLPAMGALYTMYPVLVCTEVVDGVPPYSSSGWCFCEYMEASLHGKLDQYSSYLQLPEDDQQIVAHLVGEQATAGREQIFLAAFEARLKEKVFFMEADRDTVHSIVRGTMVSRMLSDAVALQDVDSVRILLNELSVLKMKEVINYAINDKSLDTLLHVAMRLPSRAIVDALLEYGADMEQFNFCGDTPEEFHMMPSSWFRIRRTN